MKTTKRFYALSLFFSLLVFTFISCETNIEEPNLPPVASATANPTTATVGETVTLDGSASQDPENGSLTYNWAINSAPAGSSASIALNGTVATAFVPDVAGTYEIELTVTDESNNTNATTISVTATDGSGGGGGTSDQTIIVDANITSDQTWSDVVSDPTIPDYQVTTSIGVSAILTVDPGVYVVFDEDVNLQITTEGTLVANGESSNKITFTSSNETGQVLWKGIEVISTSAQNSIDHMNINYAGGAVYGSFSNFVDVPASIAMHSNAKLSLTNTSISNSGGYGVYMRYGEFTNFSNNTFNDNTSAGIGLDLKNAVKVDGNTAFSGNEHAVELYGSTLDASGEVTLSDLNGSSTYYVSGSLSINDVLNIEAGTDLSMAEDVNIFVDTNGVLAAVGTSTNKVTFISENSAAGTLWKGIEIISTDARNELTYCDISYAGNSDYGGFSNFADFPATLAMRNGARVTLNNTRIAESGGYGIYARYGTFVDFSNNVFENNTLAHIGLFADEVGSIDANTTFSGSTYAVEVFGGDNNISQEATWVRLAGGAQYNIISQVTINAGLTINPGAILHFNEDIDFDIRSAGYLAANGTSSDPITFTSSNVAGQIAWGGIKFYTSDARNSLDWVTVNYAGGNVTGDLDSFIDVGAAVTGNGNARLEITNTTISNTDPTNKSGSDNGDGYGVYFQGTINNIEEPVANNTFTNNPGGNVF